MAKKKTDPTLDCLQSLDRRLLNLERIVKVALGADGGESAVEPWQFLVRRRHPWRKQLYVKGRNLTARQLVGAMRANQLDNERAAGNFHLPIGAIREAQDYVEQNLELLQTEAEIERLMHQRERVARACPRVSG
jgi:hypothetical protein